MDWVWPILAGAAVWFLWLRRQEKKEPAAPASSSVGMNMASDRGLMLATFRRELANYLIRSDPDRYLRLYHKARREAAAVETADIETREAQFTLISKKRPFYQDFDIVGTRDHVLYADALSHYTIDDIEEHYLDLVKFHALQRALDPNWQFRSAATSDDDLTHLEEYVRKVKDTKFRQRLLAAIEQFFSRTTINRLNSDGEALAYESPAFDVYYVPHIAENRYGFHFKDTDEYGLYGSFSDDGSKTFHSYYRSDRTFKEEGYLDYLRIDEKI